MKVWGDPCLPDPDNPFVESEGPPELLQAAVNSLRLQEGGFSDLDLFKEPFNEWDQLLILHDDCWIWADDRKGCYNVKSGYEK